MGGVRHAETFFFSFSPSSQDGVVLGLRPYSNYYWCSANAPSEWTDDSNKTNASILCLAYGTTVLSGSSQHNPRCLIFVAKQTAGNRASVIERKKIVLSFPGGVLFDSFSVSLLLLPPLLGELLHNAVSLQEKIPNMADAEKHRDSLSLEAHDYEKVGLLAQQQQQQQHDIESQAAIETPHEYQASSTKKFLCLALYFALNLGVTLSNKAVLQSAQYPWLLTAVHATTTSFGCFILKRLGVFHCTKLSSRDNLKLVAFSCLFTANIATSNVSL